MRRSSYLARSTQKDPKEIYFIFFLNFILFSMNFVSLIGFLQNFKRQRILEEIKPCTVMGSEPAHGWRSRTGGHWRLAGH
jgi:hypothetical protein